MANKKWKYFNYCDVRNPEGDVVISVVTQLYACAGVYVAVYYKGASIPDQFTIKPSGMKKFMQQFAEDNLKDKTLKTIYGREMIVSDIDNKFVEVKE